jgi:hypothetical protein
MTTSSPPRSGRLPTCSRCQRPLAPGSSQCSYCGGGAPPSLPSEKPRAARTSSSTALGPLVALPLDFLLGVLTLGLGWLVWALVIFARRQSPAGQILGVVVIDHLTGGPARGLTYGFRLILVFAFSLYLAAGAVWGYGLLIDVGGYWLHSQAIPFAMLGILFVDLALLALPGHRRGVDRLLGLRIRWSSENKARAAK